MGAGASEAAWDRYAMRRGSLCSHSVPSVRPVHLTHPPLPSVPSYPPFYSDAANDNAQLFERIQEAKVAFDTPDWAPISDCAKDLIKRMLTADPATRLTAEEVRVDRSHQFCEPRWIQGKPVPTFQQVLRHPWMLLEQREVCNDNLHCTMGNLRIFCRKAAAAGKVAREDASGTPAATQSELDTGVAPQPDDGKPRPKLNHVLSAYSVRIPPAVLSSQGSQAPQDGASTVQNKRGGDTTSQSAGVRLVRAATLPADSDGAAPGEGGNVTEASLVSVVPVIPEESEVESAT
jgi:serine/threonine protein kinase